MDIRAMFHFLAINLIAGIMYHIMIMIAPKKSYEEETFKVKKIRNLVSCVSGQMH